MRLFDRVVELKVGDTDINGLDIAFEIEKDLNPEPNPCHIEIYNLSKKNRDLLSSYDRVPLALRAGYKDNVGLIFNGDMLSCRHEHEGTSWKTTLASGDGACAIQSSRINKSFAKGTPIKAVIKEIAKQLGLPFGNSLNQIESIKDVLPRGFSCSGNAMTELSNQLEPIGFSASIQSNVLEINSKNADTQEVTHLSPKSGLISTPHLQAGGMWECKTVLMPNIYPGSIVSIASSTANGHIQVQSVHFIGSNFAGDWAATLVAKSN
jgi:hypothetical protein